MKSAGGAVRTLFFFQIIMNGGEAKFIATFAGHRRKSVDVAR
jgi:hypothetical protein